MTQSKAVTCRVTVKMQGVVQQQFVVQAVQLECSRHYSHDTQQTCDLRCLTVQMQGVVQQQFVVRAIQLECKCMHHECSIHYSHDPQQTCNLGHLTVQMQGVVQQQFVVRAVQLECKCMQHECSRQGSAIQLLEAAADRRRMEERGLQHDFWDVAREALGTIIMSLNMQRACLQHDFWDVAQEALGTIIILSACSMTSGMWREKPLV